MGNWIDRTSHIPIDDTNFHKILEFYMLNCPIKIPGKSNKKRTWRNVSMRGGQYNDSNLLQAFSIHIKKEFTKQGLYKESDSKIGEVSFDNIEKEYTVQDENYNLIVYEVKHGYGKARSILYSIRCAFAHGSFEVVENKKGQKIYKFENFNTNGRLTARIRLKESVLLDWIKFIREYSPSKTKKSRKKSSKRELITTT